MKLKNYTSNIPANRTISNIEGFLAECGVTGISKKYELGRCVAILFQAPDGQRSRTIKLPCDLAAVHDTLWQDFLKGAKRQRKSKNDFAEQAERTAWKIMDDWVRVQMTLIRLQKKDFLEVFLSYVWDGSQTFFEAIKSNNFKMLPAPREEEGRQ